MNIHKHTYKANATVLIQHIESKTNTVSAQLEVIYKQCNIYSVNKKYTLWKKYVLVCSTSPSSYLPASLSLLHVLQSTSQFQGPRGIMGVQTVTEQPVPTLPPTQHPTPPPTLCHPSPPHHPRAALLTQASKKASEFVVAHKS